MAERIRRIVTLIRRMDCAEINGGSNAANGGDLRSGSLARHGRERRRHSHRIRLQFHFSRRGRCGDRDARALVRECDQHHSWSMPCLRARSVPRAWGQKGPPSRPASAGVRAFCSSWITLFLIFARQLITIFSPNPDVIPSTAQAIRGRRRSFISAALWFLQIPLAWVLAYPFGWGPTGVFVVVSVAVSALALVSATIFRQGRWKTRKVSVFPARPGLGERYAPCSIDDDARPLSEHGPDLPNARRAAFPLGRPRSGSGPCHPADCGVVLDSHLVARPEAFFAASDRRQTIGGLTSGRRDASRAAGARRETRM
jgi:hypothetical protein